jgi:hypothetical protein
VLTAGYFYRHGSWVFWDVHDPALAVVQVADPAATIAAIQAAAG